MALLAVVGNVPPWARRNPGQPRRRKKNLPRELRASEHPVITEADYPGLYQDSDHDGVYDVDDPTPHGPPSRDTVEEVSLAEEIRELIYARDDFDHVREELEQRIRDAAPGLHLKSRTKTPYSIVNKLRRKRLQGKHGLTDLAGVMALFTDRASLEAFVPVVLSGAFGPVAEHEDLYAQPKDGYMAHHFVILVRPGRGDPEAVDYVHPMLAELQLKTERMAQVAKAAHSHYKLGRLDAQAMLDMTSLIARADVGDVEAQAHADYYLSDPEQLSAFLMKRRRNPAGAPETWRHPSQAERDQRVYEAQLQALRYAQDLSLTHQARWEQKQYGEREHEVVGLESLNPSRRGTTVSNVHTGESRFYALTPGAAVAAASAADGYQFTPTEVYGHVRAGAWTAKSRRANPVAVDSFWYQLLDTIHHALHDLKDQQGWRGVAVITREQWIKLYPRIKPGGGKVKRNAAEVAWARFRQRLAQEDASGAGIEADYDPSRLSLRIAPAYDAAWASLPLGSPHPLGEEREHELLASRMTGVRGMAPGRARAEARREAQARRVASHGLYEELDAPDEGDDENVIPGGSPEAYAELKSRVRGEGTTEAPAPRVSALVNPGKKRREVDNTPRGKKPRVKKYPIAKAVELGYAEGLEDAEARFKKFHATDPSNDRIAVYEIDDGKPGVTVEHVHVALGYTPEMAYLVPWESNKKGSLWVHEHDEGSEPLEILDPATGMTRKIMRGTVVSDWWRH